MGVDLDLRRLRFFVEVVRRGGFSPAAKVLFATQPTVSKAIRQLEEELGTGLLHRAGNRSELTDAGRLVYREAQQLLAGASRLQAQLADLEGLRTGELKLGFPHLGASSLFAAEVAAFKRRHPAVRLDVVVLDGAALAESLRAGTLEIIATAARVPPEWHALLARRDELVVLLPPAHRLAGRARLSLHELAPEPFLLFDETSPLAEAVLRECAKAGFAPRVLAYTSQRDLLLQLVAAGEGIALMPRLLADLHRQPAVRAIPLRPAIPVRLSFAWRRGVALSHAARAWLEVVSERADTQAGTA